MLSVVEGRVYRELVHFVLCKCNREISECVCEASKIFEQLKLRNPHDNEKSLNTKSRIYLYFKDYHAKLNVGTSLLKISNPIGAADAFRYNITCLHLIEIDETKNIMVVEAKHLCAAIRRHYKLQTDSDESLHHAKYE